MESRAGGACRRVARWRGRAGVPAVAVVLLAWLGAVSPEADARVTLNDPIGHIWDIDDQGSYPTYDCGSGNISNGTYDAYDTFGFICVTATGSAFDVKCIDSSVYCGTVPPVSEMSGRQLLLGQVTLMGLQIQRRVYVPSAGPATADSFLRYFDTFTNPTAAPITVQIRFGSAAPWGDLGSDSSTVCVGTSSGDNVIDAGDEWMMTDDYDASGDPSLGFVVQGLGAAERLDFNRQNPFTSGYVDEVMWAYDDVTVMPGETIALLSFFIQEDSQALARAETEYLAMAQLEAVDGLTGEQLSQVRNFAFCHDCDGDGWAIEDGDCNDWSVEVNPGVTTDFCDGQNNDCNVSTPDGWSEAWYGTPCDGADPDECEEGILVCIAGAPGCNDDMTTALDICDGLDNDCNPASVDGSGDARVGASCDGPDADLCGEAIGECNAGVFECPDSTGDNPDPCNDVDDDCDPATTDGITESWWGDSCDGDDPDMCPTGHYTCSDGAQYCEEDPEGSRDVCDGLDNDCNPGTPDGYGDVRVGIACDGDDTDACAEGIGSCAGGEFVCSDGPDDTPELCDGIDNDCDPSTADGSQELWLGEPCDGMDRDLCQEGQMACVAATAVCNDTTGNIRDTCNGVDDDCDPETADGKDESWHGDPCDGTDNDLCAEGVNTCIGGIQGCNDFTGDLTELCNGVDDDCDPSTLENMDSDGDGLTPCGGDCDDGDPDVHPDAVEICADGVDGDCDPFTDHDGDGDGVYDCDGDCAPMNPAMFPGAEPNCSSGLDNDCNGLADFLEPSCGGTVEPGDDTGCSCSVPGASGRVSGPGAGQGAETGLLVLVLALIASAVSARREFT